LEILVGEAMSEEGAGWLLPCEHIGVPTSSGMESELLFPASFAARVPVA
jgi:hypothetical protein